ncbi:MAG: ATP-grasp domain-containing protein [Proteobacteria bacterium]|nr:ATP-grasp domain-containing protein [Pseudomonadota bacterium]
MLQPFTVLGQVLDPSGFAKVTSLLVLPFAHEDLAIVIGGYIIVNNIMPATLVALSIYGGIVASDFALYGIGAAARHVPWLNRYAIDARVVRFGDKLKRNVFGLVALCRVVPGVVFVAFVACGWARVSFLRFVAASLIVSALYLPLMLYLVIVFGDALDDHVGLWAWPVLLVLIGVTSLARKRIFAFCGATEEIADTPLPHSTFGMPPLSHADRKVAAAERIPPFLFYLPLVLNWLLLGFRHRCLTLPTAANPTIFTGGMWGETKSSYFRDVAPDERRWIADFVIVERQAQAHDLGTDVDKALRAVAEAGLAFPLVAKPDVGWHGHGVRCLEDRAALERYMAHFPDGVPLMLQRYVPYAAEAAVLYARMPDEPKGEILSLTFRYFPHVVGDGQSTLRMLIERDPRAQWKSSLHLGRDASHRGVDMRELDRVPERGEVVRIALIGNQRAGALYRDGRRYLTAALEERFNAIATSMREFHYGRFDLRFENVEALMRGENFSIVEINGIGGEAIDCWDPHLSVREVYRRLAAQQRLLFALGERNLARGFEPTEVGEFLISLIRQGQLIRRYPAST